MLGQQELTGETVFCVRLGSTRKVQALQHAVTEVPSRTPQVLELLQSTPAWGVWITQSLQVQAGTCPTVYANTGTLDQTEAPACSAWRARTRSTLALPSALPAK
jgi:hypothetical protein